jgi:hypothetical protein
VTVALNVVLLPASIDADEGETVTVTDDADKLWLEAPPRSRNLASERELKERKQTEKRSSWRPLAAERFAAS